MITIHFYPSEIDPGEGNHTIEQKRKRNKRLFIVIVLLLCIVFALVSLIFAGDSFYNAVTRDQTTFSIVGADPLTGDVGIAGVSCVPISAPKPIGFQKLPE